MSVANSRSKMSNSHPLWYENQLFGKGNQIIKSTNLAEMKIKLLLLTLAVCCCSTTLLKANLNKALQDSITVYIFLHDDCIISQNYTLTLKTLHKEFANEHLQFVGLFPDFASKPKNIQAFKAKYNISFLLQQDYYHTKKEAFGATVTPEVVIYNETQAQILYQGRIDDTYARVGQRRKITNTSELKDALEAIRDNQPIEVTKTEPIGCFIRKEKLSINK